MLAEVVLVVMPLLTQVLVVLAVAGRALHLVLEQRGPQILAVAVEEDQMAELPAAQVAPVS
jgi:hypothetical protein